jgi:hypothetical protein
MKSLHLIGTAAAALVLLAQPAAAQTDVITNGSFESGLTGWTTATNLGGGATGTCSYNGVTAPGTETLTSVAGFPATDGTALALGSVSQTAGASLIISCVLYQDVLIPVGATTATFSFDVGIKNAKNNICSDNAVRVGIYSAATVPAFPDTEAVVNGKLNYDQPVDTTLHSQTSLTINVSSKAGTTVRFAIINAANNTGHENIGIDNVKFMVNTTPVPTLPVWGYATLAALMGLTAVFAMRRRRLV